MAAMGVADKTPTYLPGDKRERRQLAEIRDMLADSERDQTADAEFSQMARSGQLPIPTLSVPGKASPIPLTPELADILLEVANQLLEGRAVTIVPRGMQLTTQEAADMLGISRPTFVKILESGAIPYEKVGRHRRVLLKDIEDYRQRHHEENMKKLDSLVEEENPYDTIDNPLIRKSR